MFTYARIQTNRATLTKYLKEFEAYLSSGEALIAPRPLPKHSQNTYAAYIRVADNGVNHQRAQRFKKYKELSEDEHSELIGNIKYSWTIGDDSD